MKQQFDLSVWLQDKSRKIVTRDGKPVRILCTDCGVMMSHPILTEIVCSGNAKVLEYHYIDGTTQNKNNDLFFADEEEELTEFELRLLSSLDYTRIYRQDYSEEDMLKIIKDIAQELLDLARKEIRKEQQEKLGTLEMPIDVTEPYYIKGKEDALKDLPKWKKMPSGTQGNGNFNPIYLVRVSNGHYFTTPCLSWDEDSMYLELDELENLPKE